MSSAVGSGVRAVLSLRAAQSAAAAPPATGGSEGSEGKNRPATCGSPPPPAILAPMKPVSPVENPAVDKAQRVATSSGTTVCSAKSKATAKTGRIRDSGDNPGTGADTAKRTRKRTAPLKRQKYFISRGNNSQLLLQAFKHRVGWSPAKQPAEANFVWRMYKARSDFELPHTRRAPRLLNHFWGNVGLVSKSGLFKSLRQYHAARGTNLWASVPMTFYLKAGVQDEETDRFLSAASKATSGCDEVRREIEASRLKLHPQQCVDNATHAPTPAPSVRTLNASATATPQFWIVKPASATNRGVGIRVVKSAPEVLALVNGTGTGADAVETNPKSNMVTTASVASKKKNRKQAEGTQQKKKKKKVHKRWIVQEYMARPLLYKGRKFDIRVFVLLVSRRKVTASSNPNAKRAALSSKAASIDVYIFNDGYLRTSSKKWSLDPKKLTDRLMHLTNDGVQCKAEKGGYGKYEEGNKLSYATFEEYLGRTRPEARGALGDVVLPRVRELVVESIEATSTTLNPERRSHCFELLGYDFMVDESLNTWLIEVNSNPCLEDWSCPLLKGMLPVMVNQVVGKIVGCQPTVSGRGAVGSARRDDLATASGSASEDGAVNQTSLDPGVRRCFDLVANVELEPIQGTAETACGQQGEGTSAVK